MRDHAAQHGTRDRHDDAGHDRGGESAEAEGRTQRPGEKARRASREAGEGAGRDPGILGADDAVDESDREVESRRIPQQLGQTLRRTVDGQRLGGLEPASHLRDDGVGDLPMRGSGCGCSGLR
ncbi:hypothetical protein [Homoserinibacter gongjuensis]|uniref:Uncharacterized protein n=1 Tax=Homoserinibacter gongjuensis TaxID=1162968 RepID=A0ABQ6JNG2_9MICO|nr:hypothetical protein GCM10025869_03600 [Homoserinibacter gongjuensis]